MGYDATALVPQHKYMRAFFGVVVCAALVVTTAILTRSEPSARRQDLVSGEPSAKDH